MIKCLCKENVQDKFTGENYVAGKTYGFTKERAEEVTNSRYFEYAQEQMVEKGEVIAPVKKIEEAIKEAKPKRTKKSAK